MTGAAIISTPSPACWHDLRGHDRSGIASGKASPGLVIRGDRTQRMQRQRRLVRRDVSTTACSHLAEPERMRAHAAPCAVGDLAAERMSRRLARRCSRSSATLGHVEALGDQYMRTRSGVARCSGGLIYASVSLVFDAPPAFTIDLHTGAPQLRQGVALRFVRRKGRIAGSLSERFVLWEDTAPFPVPVEYVARRAPVQLTVWNVWEGPHGATMAWTANAGVIVEDQQPGDAATWLQRRTG